jgi:hypothetical protein
VQDFASTSQSPNFNASQSAYRRHHSIETALLHILNYINEQIDVGQGILLVALDLLAAFDTVEHSVLLARHTRAQFWYPRCYNDVDQIVPGRLHAIRSLCNSRFSCYQLPMWSAARFSSSTAVICHLYFINSQRRSKLWSQPSPVRR